jgi:hypothetical protein
MKPAATRAEGRGAISTGSKICPALDKPAVWLEMNGAKKGGSLIQ